jgi:hypothetical protein
MLNDRFLNVLIHFYANPANAIYEHKLHVENLFDQQPRYQIIIIINEKLNF